MVCLPGGGGNGKWGGQGKVGGQGNWGWEMGGGGRRKRSGEGSSPGLLGASPEHDLKSKTLGTTKKYISITSWCMKHLIIVV